MRSSYEQLLDRRRAEGRAEGRATALLQLLQARFGEPSSDLVERVCSASAADLERWTLRFLTAESADDVVAEDR